MITVENFYWILFENILKPVGLDCWYYFPWGTKQGLSSALLRDFARNQDHVFFHFDQEPLWSEELGPYDLSRTGYSSKLAKILANSERSVLKKTICKSRGFLDWYFFYHGFAALDWYRDCEYVGEVQSITKKFCSYSHLVAGKRAYRMALTANFLSRNLQQHGDISFHATQQNCLHEVQDPFTALSLQQKKLINRHLCTASHLPMIVDRRNIAGDFSAHFGHQEYKLWQRSLWHVVNETVFYDKKLHLTEKIFKPIVAGRPFILVAAPGNLAYLRSYGFETFGQWIDESYDNETDAETRLDMITSEVEKICSKSPADLRSMLDDMRYILEYNKQHFFGQFKKLIVAELVENFDSCVRQWNNGRVDGRELVIHPDLESVKQILLR